MTDSSSQSDDYASSGNCRSGRRKSSAYSTSLSSVRRKKGSLNAKERNLRRLESNERERMRMHSLNDAFQVSLSLIVDKGTSIDTMKRKRSTYVSTLSIPFVDNNETTLASRSGMNEYFHSLTFFIKILITSTIYVLASSKKKSISNQTPRASSSYPTARTNIFDSKGSGREE
jgi:hypothetical protein